MLQFFITTAHATAIAIVTYVAIAKAIESSRMRVGLHAISNLQHAYTVCKGLPIQLYATLSCCAFVRFGCVSASPKHRTHAKL